jgi:hypothetical protein
MLEFRGRCPDCGHAWNGHQATWDCGCIDSRRPETYRCYFCCRCAEHLRVPRRLRRRSWLVWVPENTFWIVQSRLLFEACERVARALAGARSRYALVPVDIGTIVCPRCNDPMAIGDIETTPLVCPGCKRRSARLAREHRPCPIIVDHCPQPGEVVSRVILHLKELAEHPKGHRSDGSPLPPTFEGPGPLWDRELDG